MKKIFIIIFGLISSVVQSAGIQDECEKIKHEISLTDSPWYFVTYSEIVKKHVEDVYFVNFFGRQLPLPKENYSNITFTSKDGKPHIVVLKAEEDVASVKFVFDADTATLMDTQKLFQMSFFEMLDYGFSLTPDNINCSGSVINISKDLIAIGMKGLLFNLWDTTKVYKKDWGWFVETSTKNYPNRTSVKLIVSESSQVNIHYDTKLSRRHIGHMFDNKPKDLPKSLPPVELINLSACLSARSSDCLMKLEGLKVRELK